MKSPWKLAEDTYVIDGMDMGLEGRTGTYVLTGENIVLVETGASLSVKEVKAGLQELDISLDRVKTIILTHIHLDHAGGAGLLLQDCPNAEVIVHEKGKRHLIDPSRLIQGAKMVYGTKFNELFDPIVPIPESRLCVKKEGETMPLSPERVLTFYDTPGHAKHHLGIHDSLTNGIFTGDTCGIRYHQTDDHGLIFHLPTTSPNQFDPGAMEQSIRMFRDLNPDRLYFGHFGMGEDPDQTFDQVLEWLPVFTNTSYEILSDGGGVRDIQTSLMNKVSSFLKEHGIPDDHHIYTILKLDMEVCAMGLADYWMNTGKQTGSS
ncbi:MBL fold metallo-hydrolase [Halobacillus sp. ACCC02827]|uniref:MBL fold metallo-hydrolase n=1 Tax=Halobacillus sp. ACCC02827 TaxID=3052090 RepID=UPI0025710720|nr:MBL fold metallo-hydrolase [Halobacillus sp. ACCC02827]WJE16009.1 MBL fold metallo-hydrolase [Halobacillus sp. ACCC02827]